MYAWPEAAGTLRTGSLSTGSRHQDRTADHASRFQVAMRACSVGKASEGGAPQTPSGFRSPFGREIALQDRCAESSELGAWQSLIGVLELILDNMRLSPRRSDQVGSQGAAAVLPSLRRFETTTERGAIGVGKT